MKEINKKQFYLTLGIMSLCFIVFLILLGVFSKFDLAVSIKLASNKKGEYYTHNVVAILVEAFVPSIPYLLGLFFSCATGDALKKLIKNKKLGTTLYYVFIGIGFLLSIIHTNSIINYFVQNSWLPKKWYGYMNLSLIVEAGFGIILITLSLLLIKKLDLNPISTIKFTVFLILSVALGNILINIIIKPLFPRSRYRAMMYLDNGSFEYFTAWWTKGVKRLDLANATKDMFKSFPSGHTGCGAAITFTLAFIPYFFAKGNNKKTRIITIVVPVIITLLTAIYRIRAGAHFLSDVTMGAFLGILSCYLPFLLVYYLCKKYIDKKRIAE